MPYTARPTKDLGPAARIQWCDADKPLCPRGHVLHDVHPAPATYATCRSKIGTEPCREHVWVVAFKHKAAVIRLTPQEFAARNSERLSPELERDLWAFFEGFLEACRRADPQRRAG